MMTSLHAANIFIEKSMENAAETGGRLTPMQVQKLVYFLHGWGYAVYNRRIIQDEVEAWKHGPVYPLLHAELKEWGDGEIMRKIALAPHESFTDERNLADKVYNVLSRYEGWELSNMTHQKGTPWHKVYMNPFRLPFKLTIPEDLIKEHFQNAFRESVAA